MSLTQAVVTTILVAISSGLLALSANIQRAQLDNPHKYSLPAGIQYFLPELKETFTCEGRPYGYYADPHNDCKIYHICVPVKDSLGYVIDTQHYTQVCNHPTVFNQLTLTCTYPEDAPPCGNALNYYGINSLFGGEDARYPELLKDGKTPENVETTFGRHFETFQNPYDGARDESGAKGRSLEFQDEGRVSKRLNNLWVQRLPGEVYEPRVEKVGVEVNEFHDRTEVVPRSRGDANNDVPERNVDVGENYDFEYQPVPVMTNFEPSGPKLNGNTNYNFQSGTAQNNNRGGFISHNVHKGFNDGIEGPDSKKLRNAVRSRAIIGGAITDSNLAVNYGSDGSSSKGPSESFSNGDTNYKKTKIQAQSVNDNRGKNVNMNYDVNGWVSFEDYRKQDNLELQKGTSKALEKNRETTTEPENFNQNNARGEVVYLRGSWHSDDENLSPISFDDLEELEENSENASGLAEEDEHSEDQKGQLKDHNSQSLERYHPDNFKNMEKRRIGEYDVVEGEDGQLYAIRVTGSDEDSNGASGRKYRKIGSVLDIIRITNGHTDGPRWKESEYESDKHEDAENLFELKSGNELGLLEDGEQGMGFEERRLPVSDEEPKGTGSDQQNVNLNISPEFPYELNEEERRQSGQHRDLKLEDFVGNTETVELKNRDNQENIGQEFLKIHHRFDFENNAEDHHSEANFEDEDFKTGEKRRHIETRQNEDASRELFKINQNNPPEDRENAQFNHDEENSLDEIWSWSPKKMLKFEDEEFESEDRDKNAVESKKRGKAHQLDENQDQDQLNRSQEHKEIVKQEDQEEEEDARIANEVNLENGARSAENVAQEHENAAQDIDEEINYTIEAENVGQKIAPTKKGRQIDDPVKMDVFPISNIQGIHLFDNGEDNKDQRHEGLEESKTLEAKHQNRRKDGKKQRVIGGPDPNWYRLPGSSRIATLDSHKTFDCYDKPFGYYADIDNECKVYHVCVPELDAFTNFLKTVHHFSFVCEKQAVFDQMTPSCSKSQYAQPCSGSNKHHSGNPSGDSVWTRSLPTGDLS